MLRTHTCGELRKQHKGKEIILAGWVHSIRYHGNVTFIDVKDRYGITQLVFDETLKEKAQNIKKDYVIQIEGKVVEKPQPNKTLATGEIEIHVNAFEILNKSEQLPVDDNSTEETRLKFRYLDLRRKQMQKNLITKHKVSKAVRDFLDKNNFLELETPILAKSTPEGARDYLVPSRINKGEFYALPQSPQIFKQLFMVSGLDKYFQIVKCFRDEDLRADRQPEFTQIDIEMSFITEEDIYKINEKLISEVWEKVLNEKLKIPFPRMSYQEAMEKYGSDKPDLRFGLQLEDVTKIAKKSDFKVFQNAECIKCIRVKSEFSRKQIDKLTSLVKIYEAKGLAYLKPNFEGPIAKFLENIKDNLNQKDEFIFFVADKKRIVNAALGALRLHLGKKLDLIKKQWNFVWITDFPMFEWSEEEERYVSMHHPFTGIKDEHLKLLETNPKKAISKAYDLTLNGVEIGGGSIRIHKQEIQEKVFKALNINDQEAQEKFGFLLKALKFGAPPHGGIAYGLDRLVALITNNDSIREVIPFPKNKDAEDLMMQAPSKVNKKQLEELGIDIKK